jgi:hypothetical protein
MTDWLIATPAWGERCVDHFVNTVAPAIKFAASRISGRLRFIVHTDSPARIDAALGVFGRQLLPVPPGVTPHHSLGAAHRGAIASTALGEAIAFINADMVPSIECFAAAEARFQQGKRLVMTAGTRTLSTERPPIGSSARGLLSWAWQHRHPWIVGCTWGEGRTNLPSLLHFRSGGNVVLRGFHLHPFAVLKEKDFGFRRDTIDHDLMDAFSKDEIHVVTDADELGFAEMSPRERDFGYGRTISVQSIAAWATRGASPTHRWLFQHRIVLAGKPGDEIGDTAICRQILAQLDGSAPQR